MEPTPSQQIVGQIDPDRIKAIVRAVLGIVAIFVPASRVASLLQALLDLVAIQSRGDRIVTQGVERLAAEPIRYGSLAPEAVEAAGIDRAYAARR